MRQPEIIREPGTFKCKCGNVQEYHAKVKHAPHPTEVESQVITKFFKQANNNGFMVMAGIELAGANGGHRCDKCTQSHQIARRNAREKRIAFETAKKLVKPASAKEEEIHAKRNGKRL